MRLRATIIIDIDAKSFADAAAQQERVERVYSAVKDAYSQARLEFRQRRTRVSAHAQSTSYVPSGRMSDYEE
jgi:hypothetical protein